MRDVELPRSNERQNQNSEHEPERELEQDYNLNTNGELRTWKREQPSAAQSLRQMTSDQIFGKFTFEICSGCRSACARKPGRSRSDLKPMCTVNGEMARSRRDRIAFALRKWLRMTIFPPRLQTRRISLTTWTGSGTTLTRYGA